MLTTLPFPQMLRFAIFVAAFLLAAVALFLLSGVSILKEGQVRIRYRKGKEPEILAKGTHFAFPFTCKESRKITLTPHKQFKDLIIEVKDPLLFDAHYKETKKFLKTCPRTKETKIREALSRAGAELLEIKTK